MISPSPNQAPVAPSGAQANLGDILAQLRDALLGFSNSFKPASKAINALGRRANFSGTVSAGQAGNQLAFFPFDARPQTGRLWSIRKIVIFATGGGPFSPALANVNACLFITGQPVSPPNLDASVPNLAVPTSQVLGAHMATIRGQEFGVVGFQGSGVTTGLQVYGFASCLEIDDDPDLLTVL